MLLYKDNKMGLFEDLHLLICLVVLIFLFGKVRAATQSRILGIAVAGFVVFFIFFQHVWIAFLFFFIMFGYLFLGGFTSGVMEGYMTHAYMGMLGNMSRGGGAMPIMPLQMPTPGGGGSSWFGSAGYQK
jgi:hypothetical protein